MAEIVQCKSRETFLVLFRLIELDQELASALQRQSKRNQRDICGLVTFEGKFYFKKNTNLR